MSRVGIGCMRLSTDEDRDEPRALETLRRALDGGVTWFDTARAYGQGESEYGHNERLVGAALAARAPLDPAVRVVTKCGMTRPNGGWKPDGRASRVLADASASSRALGRPADILLLHAPDPSVPFATSARALLRAMDAGHAKAIGLSNVSRGQLEAFASLTSTALGAVEVGLGAYDDAAARGGVIAWCKERGVPLLAHAPLGGPSRASGLRRDSILRTIALRYRVTPAMIAIAYLLALDEIIVPLVGARRPESVESAIAAEAIALDGEDLAVLDQRFPGLGMVRRPPRRPSLGAASAEVVIVMGVAGSGKTRLAEAYVARGYERLNRDLLGGTLRGVAQRLERVLEAGATRVVLDNTYLTRASRSEVVRVAHAANASVRCVHVSTPSDELHVNCVLRMLRRHGQLLGGAELASRAKADANLFAPTTLSRMERQLEVPAEDEGFSEIETLPFVREHEGGSGALVVPLELVLDGRGGSSRLREDAARVLGHGPPDGPVLLYGWRPGADVVWRRGVEAVVSALRDGARTVEVAVCSHGSGPPVCWCRPPLPGLWVAFALAHRIDKAKSTILTRTPAHRAMAKALGLVDLPLPENHGVGSEVE